MALIIDAHVHVQERVGAGGPARQATAAALLSQMETAAVRQAVVLALDPLVSNEFVASVCRQHAEKLVGFASVNPWNTGAAMEELERAVHELGLRGLKLHPRLQEFGVDDLNLVRPLVERAAQLRIPVVVDAFPQGADWYKRREVEMIGALASAVPQATLIMAHGGGFRVWEAFVVLRSCRNVLIDLSLTPHFFRGSRIVQDLAYVVRRLGPERVLFGSDFPDVPLDTAVHEAEEILTEAGFDTEARSLVMGGNMSRLLG